MDRSLPGSQWVPSGPSRHGSQVEALRFQICEHPFASLHAGRGCGTDADRHLTAPALSPLCWGPGPTQLPGMGCFLSGVSSTPTRIVSVGVWGAGAVQWGEDLGQRSTSSFEMTWKNWVLGSFQHE